MKEERGEVIMKRTLFLVAVLVAFATGASAATLSVVSDKTTYAVGETITLSVNGDAQGASSTAIFGRLQFDGSLVNNNTNTQKLIGAASDWVKGGLSAGDTNAVGPTTGFAEAFNQVSLNGGFQTATSPISTITLVAQAVGVVSAQWNQVSGSGFELGYFGITNSPGATFTIIPEPSTVALLGLGLIGLAVSGRRRS
jgi:hypothetical protein